MKNNNTMIDPHEVEKHEGGWDWDWFLIGCVAFLFAFGLGNLIAIYG